MSTMSLVTIVTKMARRTLSSTLIRGAGTEKRYNIELKGILNIFQILCPMIAVLEKVITFLERRKNSVFVMYHWFYAIFKVSYQNSG